VGAQATRLGSPPTEFDPRTGKMMELSVCSCRRLCDDEDVLSEVAAEAVPSQVRDWLALTFTRSMSSLKRTAQDKPKFRSVANVIRAGIMVDRFVLVHFAASN